MKDSVDTTNYIAQHAVFCEHLLDVGAPWGETDAIYHMLMGLPHMPIWQQSISLLKQCMHNESMASAYATATNPIVHTFTFESCVSCITSKAARHIVIQHTHSSCPSSEYANAATTSTVSGTNTITGLHMHKHNPQGIFCTMPGCNKGNHDHTHCYGKGGGDGRPGTMDEE